jgi:outer membrane protein assembly factor BamB
VIVVLQMTARFLVPLVTPDAGVIVILGGLVGAVAILLWWLFFSRLPWLERIGGVVLIIAAVAATRPFLHISIATGLQARMFYVYAVPTFLGLALVAWAAVRQRLSPGPRWASLAGAILLACASWALVRTDGITGDASPQLAWRWSKTHEETLSAKIAAEPSAQLAAAAPVAKLAPEPTAKPVDKSASEAQPATVAAEMRVLWSGFRGPGRDSIVRGVRIRHDWAAAPPVELWRRPVGPGWSSFAASDDVAYTQEQRGEEEVVVCYQLKTGRTVWIHKDAARFWESNGGAGPRGTPELHGGRLYTLGATGILNALDARSGAVAWSRNVASETSTKVPGWGFAGSPLITDNLVIVGVSGTLAAYDRETGNPRWSRMERGGSYSSPHPATIGGVAQIVLMNAKGAVSVSPLDGKVLWEHSWPGSPIVQPAVTGDGDFLVTTGGAMGSLGLRRIKVAQGTAGWTVEERWTSTGLKPYFNDFVAHKGHAYGFDGFLLSCIDLTDGKRKWKGGRYGNGQLMLLADQDLLLVVSEEGEVALVKATPDEFAEVARFRAIEGKTWNHPVLAGDVLLVRNAEEMAAFRLSVEGH